MDRLKSLTFVTNNKLYQTDFNTKKKNLNPRHENKIYIHRCESKFQNVCCYYENSTSHKKNVIDYRKPFC